MPFMNLIKNIGYVFVAIAGGIAVAHKTMALGDVQAFLQYVNQFTQPITQLANLANTIQATIVSAERIFEVLDEDEMKEPTEVLPDERTDAKIKFEHVKFGYSNKEILMKDFNFEANPGKMVAIVGPTGSRKNDSDQPFGTLLRNQGRRNQNGRNRYAQDVARRIAFTLCDGSSGHLAVHGHDL